MAVGSLDKRAYRVARRLAARVINQTPGLDNLIGPTLRRLDARLATDDLWMSLASSEVSFDGLTLEYRVADRGIARSLVLKGTYEPETVQAVVRSVRQGGSFCDLGAHIGFFTLLAARLVGPDGHVFAFEAAPETVEFLKRNVQRNQFESVVEVVPKAITGDPGMVAMNIDDQNSVSSAITDSPGRNSILVEATSLDSFFEGRGWPPVDMIKMDIEGAEFAALQGMSNLSDKNPHLRLIIELNRQRMRSARITVPALFARLRDLGFERFLPLWRRAGWLSFPTVVRAMDRLTQRVNINVLAIKQGPSASDSTLIAHH